MVAFVFRFRTHAFADSSQLGSLTELNFPVSDPKKIKDVISNRFYDAFHVTFLLMLLTLLLAMNHTKCKEKNPVKTI